MRIIHIFQRDDPATGGALRVAEALVKEQSARGLEVWILFLYGPPAKVSAQFKDGQAICLGLPSSREALRGILALRKTIRQLSPDIIHSHDGIVWPRIALLWVGIPVVMHAHLPAGDPHTIKERIGWALNSKTTDFLIGISYHTIESWVAAKFPITKIRYIPNGVDFERFHMVSTEEKRHLRQSLGLPEFKRILLWIGQLNRSMKGSDRMEHVAARLPDDTVLLVVGHGPEFNGIQERCKRLLESGKMVMTGTVSEPAKYYMASDAFMFTSYHEPFGLVILEALACGLPIMAFPLLQGGGAADLLSEFRAVQVSDKMSEREIEIALQELEVRKKDVGELRTAARENYNWSMLSDRVVDLYQFILGCQPLRVLVCQQGARHRYAVPRMLDAAGILSGFYTDSSAVSLIGKCVKFMGNYAPDSWKGFSRWDIRGVPRAKIFSTDQSFFIELVQKIFRVQKNGIQLYRQRHRILSSKMKKWGLQESNAVYSMYHENLDFVRWIKDQGALSLVDVFISPVTDQIMEQETADFPEWTDTADPDELEFERKLWDETVSMADLLICPSKWVAEGVRAASPVSATKIKVVPYGCSIDFQGRVNKPVKGRVLFAGRDPLRKGLHYLAQAETQLKSIIPELDVRVAGVPSSVEKIPLCKNLNFLGQLDGDQMKEEYLSADVLVLPALSEGFAGVVAEAISAGCPVIVTKEAGSPVINGREGLIVPSKDMAALASSIQRMVTDRSFRANCSSECLKQIPFYSEMQWRERLVEALEECAEFGERETSP